MGYIEQNLVADERIIFKGAIHWMRYARPILIIFLGVLALYWNVWAVSLYDLIVVFDQIEKEESLMDYLVAHSNVQKTEIEFQDELDVFANFKNGNINEIIKSRPSMIIGGSEDFDAKYENRLPLAYNQS